MVRRSPDLKPLDTPIKRVAYISAMLGLVLIVVGVLAHFDGSHGYRPRQRVLSFFVSELLEGPFEAFRRWWGNQRGGRPLLAVWVGLLMAVWGGHTAYGCAVCARIFDNTAGRLVRWIKTGKFDEPGIGRKTEHLVVERGPLPIDDLIQKGIDRQLITQNDALHIRNIYAKAVAAGKTESDAKRAVIDWCESEAEERRRMAASRLKDLAGDPFERRVQAALKPVEKKLELGRWNGCGLTFLGAVQHPKLKPMYFTEHWFTFLWLPLFRLGTYLVTETREGYRIHGRISRMELQTLSSNENELKTRSGLADGFTPVFFLIFFWGLIVAIGLLFSR